MGGDHKETQSTKCKEDESVNSSLVLGCPLPRARGSVRSRFGENTKFSVDLALVLTGLLLIVGEKAPWTPLWSPGSSMTLEPTKYPYSNLSNFRFP